MRRGYASALTTFRASAVCCSALSWLRKTSAFLPALSHERLPAWQEAEQVALDAQRLAHCARNAPLLAACHRACKQRMRWRCRVQHRCCSAGSSVAWFEAVWSSSRKRAASRAAPSSVSSGKVSRWALAKLALSAGLSPLTPTTSAPAPLNTCAGTGQGRWRRGERVAGEGAEGFTRPLYGLSACGSVCTTPALLRCSPRTRRGTCRPAPVLPG